MAPPASQAVEQLRQHFLSLPADQQADGWEAMWQKQVTPWDRSIPNPALVDVLKEKSSTLGRPIESKRRKKALVPGCGAGYDVVLLASYGYDAVGLDTAATAVKNARALQASEEHERKDYPIQDNSIGAGSADFMLANFFSDDFLTQTGSTQFDLIYDYTFLCALPPSARSQWAKRMTDLLARDGTLICLEFPLGKPASAGGPPHGLQSDVYTELFKSPGKDIEYSDDGKVVTTTKSSTGLKRVAHWQPVRSHHAGQGNDMVSLWQHV